MTCKHSKDDPSCSSHKNYIRLYNTPKQDTVNPKEAEILDVCDTSSGYIVLKVKYPSCVDCSYEGTKVMVFKGITLLDIIKWRKIDPHFRPTSRTQQPSEAPSPVARFPGSDEGWKAAIDYARWLSTSKIR
jgi:hypothetical protein